MGDHSKVSHDEMEEVTPHTTTVLDISPANRRIPDESDNMQDWWDLCAVMHVNIRKFQNKNVHNSLLFAIPEDSFVKIMKIVILDLDIQKAYEDLIEMFKLNQWYIACTCHSGNPDLCSWWNAKDYAISQKLAESHELDVLNISSWTRDAVYAAESKLKHITSDQDCSETPMCSVLLLYGYRHGLDDAEGKGVIERAASSQRKHVRWRGDFRKHAKQHLESLLAKAMPQRAEFQHIISDLKKIIAWLHYVQETQYEFNVTDYQIACYLAENHPDPNTWGGNPFAWLDRERYGKLPSCYRSKILPGVIIGTDFEDWRNRTGRCSLMDVNKTEEDGGDGEPQGGV